MATYWYNFDPSMIVEEVGGEEQPAYTKGYTLPELDDDFSIVKSVNELDTLVYTGTTAPDIKVGGTVYEGTSFAGARPPGR